MLNRPAVFDAAVLLVRLVLGAWLMQHGWRQLTTVGLDSVTSTYTAWNFPNPGLWAPVGALLQLIGGAGLLLGLLTPLAGLLVGVFLSVFCYFLVSRGGFPVEATEVRLTALSAAAALLLAVIGAGRASADELLNRYF